MNRISYPRFKSFVVYMRLPKLSFFSAELTYLSYNPVAKWKKKFYAC